MTYALFSLLLPLATALLLLLAHSFTRMRQVAGALVLGASAASLVCAGLALNTAVTEGVQTLSFGHWPLPLGIRLQLTALNALLLIFIALLHLLVGLYAWWGRQMTGLYWPLSAILHATLASLVLCTDLFSLYISLELLSLTAVALVSLSGPSAYNAALNYLLLSLAASLCYLLGVAIMYAHYGLLDTLLLSEIVEADFSTQLALALMSLGLMVKGALWPLHFWLPPAHTHAPTPVSALLSGLVVKGPLFLLWHFWSQLAPEELARQAGPFFALGGAAALVSGGWSALRAAYLKTLVAYSTVAQLGYALMGIGLLLYSQEERFHVALWLFVLAHGLAKASMFLAAGEMQTTFGSKRVLALKGATQTAPIAMSAFALAGTSLIGLPPTGGFLAKWVLLEPIFDDVNRWPWAFGVVLGTVVSAGYVFRAISLGFYQAPSNRPPYHPDRLAQWLTMLPALLVWGLALGGAYLVVWLEGVTG